LGKLSEVLYEVDCGRNNEPQLIHCDRLKRKIKQRLRGESERDTDPVEIDREEVVEDIRPGVGSEIVNVQLNFLCFSGCNLCVYHCVF
jgi:hypothetical protein